MVGVNVQRTIAIVDRFFQYGRVFRPAGVVLFFEDDRQIAERPDVLRVKVHRRPVGRGRIVPAVVLLGDQSPADQLVDARSLSRSSESDQLSGRYDRR